ncbi:MAG: hypothetical protein NTZ64_15160 [Polaromonas sp.]|nr:hypothetical protein [Polaromonas sp.]
MQKIVNPLQTCQQIGVCLNAVRACTGVCHKQAQQRQPVQRRTPAYSFAPGVIEAYYRPLTRAEHLARALVLATGIAGYMAVLARLAGVL